MKRSAYLIIALLLGPSFTGHAGAQTAGTSTIAVEHAWARATPGGVRTGAAYLTLIERGSSGDRLLGATTPVADKVQFHSTAEEDGVSRMREMHTIDLAAGAKVTFGPGGMHIMLVRLKQPLQEGQTFQLTMMFEKAGKVDVTVPVMKVGAMQPSDMHSMTHDHDDMMNTMKK